MLTLYSVTKALSSASDAKRGPMSVITAQRSDLNRHLGSVLTGV
jgi:hypothetical protein